MKLKSTKRAADLTAWVGAVFCLALLTGLGIQAYQRQAQLDYELLLAIRRWDGKAVREALLRGANVSVRDSERTNALMVLCAYRDVGGVEYALGKGVDVNGTTRGGMTALMAAALKGDPIVVKKLLISGADVHKGEALGGSALTWAQEGKATSKRKAAYDEVIRILRDAETRRGP